MHPDYSVSGAHVVVGGRGHVPRNSPHVALFSPLCLTLAAASWVPSLSAGLQGTSASWAAWPAASRRQELFASGVDTWGRGAGGGGGAGSTRSEPHWLRIKPDSVGWSWFRGPFREAVPADRAPPLPGCDARSSPPPGPRGEPYQPRSDRPNRASEHFEDTQDWS